MSLMSLKGSKMVATRSLPRITICKALVSPKTKEVMGACRMNSLIKSMSWSSSRTVGLGVRSSNRTTLRLMTIDGSAEL